MWKRKRAICQENKLEKEEFAKKNSAGKWKKSRGNTGRSRTAGDRLRLKRGMSPMYEEKGWEKDKVMTQANKKDKDRGGRLRSQVWGLYKEKSISVPFLLSSTPRSFLVCPFEEFREKYKGFIPPFRKLNFFLSIG